MRALRPVTRNRRRGDACSRRLRRSTRARPADPAPSASGPPDPSPDTSSRHGPAPAAWPARLSTGAPDADVAIAEISSTWLLPTNARLPDDHFVQEHAEREDVRPGVGLAAFQLLRRHVLQRADHGARRRQIRSRRQGRQPTERRSPPPALPAPNLGQPEVEQLRSARRQHDVGRLQVAVHHAPAVRLVQRVGNLETQLQASSRPSAPRSSRAASVSPSRYSMTRKSIAASPLAGSRGRCRAARRCADGSATRGPALRARTAASCPRCRPNAAAAL